MTASSLVIGQSNSALLDISDDIELGPECLRCEWLFDYTPHRINQEAEVLAMELTGALRAPDAEYDRILRGEYQHREDPDPSYNEDLRDAAKSYAEGAKDLFGQVADAAKRVADDFMGSVKR